MKIVIHFFKVSLIVSFILFLMVAGDLVSLNEQIEVAEPTLSIIPAVAALIAAGISAAGGAAKMGVGISRKKKGERQMEEAIESIKYSRPEEYSQIMNILGTRTDTITSRREAVEGRVERGTRAGVSTIGQLADSPVAALTAYSGLKERETKAISDIGIEFESMRDEALMG